MAEAAIQQFARDSSDRLADLRQRAIAAAGSGTPGAPAVPAILRGGPELRDAWGKPIALLPRQLPAVGIAPDDGPFFVSAGPDGSFLTLSDNLYSYDLPALLPRPAASVMGAAAQRLPATRFSTPAPAPMPGPLDTANTSARPSPAAP